MSGERSAIERFQDGKMRMNVGFDVAQTCQERAGCGWATDLLIRALVKAAPEIQFDLYHQFGTWLNWSTRNGTHLEAPNVTEPFRRMPPRQATKFWKAVAAGEAVLPGKPDIVHANSFQAPAVGPIPLVYTVYDISFWINPQYTTEANRIVCQKGTLDAIARSAAFVFISKHAQSEFERLFPGLIRRKGILTTVAYYGSRFPAVAVARDAFPGGDWLTVGSLEPRKNYETLLASMESYWERSAIKRPLRIAGGKGWKSDSLHSQIRSLEAKGIVKFEGYVSDQRLFQLYRESFALLFPTHYEGFGLPVVEAMSQACPVITRNHTSLPEVGGAAAIYTENDPAEIADAMLKLETDSGHYASISKESLNQASQFSWSNAAEKVLQIYQQLA
jgi:glycosyltransferase involved in cell wall biosynthesis